jgi:hypothetical protein
MKFTSTRYPNLKVRTKDGAYLRFVDGELEVKDQASIELLKGLPEDREVAPASAKRAAE